jgi:hypothetical protein
MNLALLKNGRNFEGSMGLSKNAISCINWWLSPEVDIPRFFGHRVFDLTLESDASRLGWGGHCDTQVAGGRWDTLEQSRHINWLELKAFHLCLLSFAGNLSGVNIRAKLDNTCAIHYIQAQGGVVQDLNDLAREIWLWCKSRSIWIEAGYIPTSVNVIADSKSRVFSNSTEWSLCPKVFDTICHQFQVPDVDLFASRLNFKVKRYVACEPDPFCFAVDAFQLDWSTLGLCYCFPPFNLISKVLNKCIHDKAELLIVVPNWETQAWYPVLHDLVVDHIRLPVHRKTVGLPFEPDKEHPIWNRLSLICFRLSGRKHAS